MSEILCKNNLCRNEKIRDSCVCTIRWGVFVCLVLVDSLHWELASSQNMQLHKCKTKFYSIDILIHFVLMLTAMKANTSYTTRSYSSIYLSNFEHTCFDYIIFHFLKQFELYLFLLVTTCLACKLSTMSFIDI